MGKRKIPYVSPDPDLDIDDQIDHIQTQTKKFKSKKVDSTKEKLQKKIDDLKKKYDKISKSKEPPGVSRDEFNKTMDKLKEGQDDNQTLVVVSVIGGLLATGAGIAMKLIFKSIGVLTRSIGEISQFIARNPEATVQAATMAVTAKIIKAEDARIDLERSMSDSDYIKDYIDRGLSESQVRDSYQRRKQRPGAEPVDGQWSRRRSGKRMEWA